MAFLLKSSETTNYIRKREGGSILKRYFFCVAALAKQRQCQIKRCDKGHWTM